MPSSPDGESAARWLDGKQRMTSSAMGIASIDGLGLRGAGFHTREEQIGVATLVHKAQALRRFLASRPA